MSFKRINHPYNLLSVIKKLIWMINIAGNHSKSAWRPLPRWMQNFKSTGAGSFRDQANLSHFSFPATGTKRNVLACEFYHHLLNWSVDNFRQLPWKTEKFPASSNIFTFAPVCEQTIMPDPHKAFWQYMQQKPADKLDGIYGRLVCLSGIPIFIRKGYLSVFKWQDTIVGNGNPVGIAREVFKHILRLLNGFPDISHPIASITAIHQCLKSAGSSHIFGFARENQIIIFIGFL